TVRSRTELHLYNAETLKAQTKLEYFAVDRDSRKLLIAPKTAAVCRQRKNRGKIRKFSPNVFPQ
ncbi:hypothetical protein NM75643_0662, partial [Neisseria meningitidis 75643]